MADKSYITIKLGNGLKMVRRIGNRRAESRFKHFQVLWYGAKIPIMRNYAATIASMAQSESPEMGGCPATGSR